MNLKRIIPNKNKIFVSWMVSYALILIIPIVVASITYIISLGIIKDEVSKAQSASMEQVKSIVDGKIQEIDRLSSEFSLNQKLNNIMNLEHPLEGNDILNIIDIQKDIAKFKVSNNFIDDIYVYINNNNFIFTESTSYEEDEFENTSNKYFFMSSSELMSLVHSNQFRNYKIVKKDIGNGKTENKVVIFQSIYLTDFKVPKATLIIVIDENKFNQLLQNVEWTSQANMLVVNSRNEFIGTEGISSLPSSLSYDNLKSKASTFYGKIAKNEMAISHIKSEYIPWEYVSIIHSKVFLEKVEYIKNIIYIYIIMCLISGLLVAYFFAKKNYSPVEKMTKMFNNRLGKLSSKEENEFSFLENSLKKLFDENESFFTKLSQQNEAMRNNLLIRLAKGRINNVKTLRDSLEAYTIKFESDNFLVIIFSIDKLCNQYFEENDKENEDAANLIYFIIRNVVEELLEKKYFGYMSEIDGRMTCVVNVRMDDGQELRPELIKDDIVQIISKAIEFIELRFGIILSVSISEMHTEINGIAKAYSEALEIIEYKTLIGDENRIIHYSSVYSPTNNIGENYNLEKEIQFINCIKAEDYKSANDILDSIITNDLGKNIQSLQVIKCRMFGLINSMLNAMGEIKTQLDVEFFDELDPIRRLLSTKSITELKAQVKYILERIGEYYSQRHKEQLPAWVDDVTDFVKNHYSESDLSIASIADQFNMSNSYLSRTFKKHMGFGLLDYIHKIRLERAKLLMNTELNIKDIAEKVGYMESNAMIRAFKRYEGVTPGKFRES
jgi:AraC-type DNA-binding domain-containing proteins